MKSCKDCKQLKSFEFFFKLKRSKDGHDCRCKPCYMENIKKHPSRNVQAIKAKHKANPEIRRQIDRRQKFKKMGVSQEWYAAQYAKQGGLCAICQSPETRVHNGTLCDLSIDHDHSCCPGTGKSCGKCVRGLLCSLCNSGLGYFKDDLPTFQRIVSYLSKEFDVEYQS